MTGDEARWGAGPKAIDTTMGKGSDRLSLAEAVATGPRAMLIDPENRSLGWTTLRDAVASGRSYAVEVQADVLAVDCDDEHSFRALDDVAVRVRGAGITPVLVNSGRGRHLFARTVDIRPDVKGLDIRRVIRPPLSPHRCGLQVGLLNVTPKEALAALQRNPSHPLAERIFRLARYGDDLGRYGKSDGRVDRSAAIQAVLVDAVANGWSLDRARALIERGPLVERFAGANPANVARWWASSWASAERYVAANPPIRDRGAALEELGGLRSAADSIGWGGRTGPTDRAVLEAHLATAERTGRINYNLAVRDAADLSGVSAPTVRASQQRLLGEGWLQVIDQGRFGTATLWRLKLPRALLSHTYLYGGCEQYGKEMNAHDAFRWAKGLGKTSALVLGTLIGLDVSITAAELSRLQGWHPSRARRALNRLGRYQLAERLDDGTWRALDRDLDEVAVELGSAGMGKRQRRQHHRDRTSYAVAYNVPGKPRPWWSASDRYVILEPRIIYRED